MFEKGKQKTRLMFCLILCTLFITATVSCAMGQPVKPQDTKNILLSFFIHDWDWWTNKPNIILIPSGNVGIGTDSPSMKLDVAGSINAIPILGKWVQNQTRLGEGNFTWDVQLFNTNQTYLGWIAGQDHIVILKKGYYQINVNVVQYFISDTIGIVEIKRNDEVISCSQSTDIASGRWFNHHFVDIGYSNENDIVSIYSRSPDYPWPHRYGNGLSSTMSIVRLN